MFADSFLDRLILELEDGSRDHLDMWANVGGPTELGAQQRRLVVQACAVVSASYVTEHGPDIEIISYLATRGADLDRRIESAYRRGRMPKEIDPAKIVSRDEVVLGLLAALNARDADTCEHSRAVGQWSARLAKALGLDEEQQELANLAGTLHDVGKVATPREILLKPGELTAAEWVEMRAHVKHGVTILEAIPSLKHIAPFVAAHHERMDGVGYPLELDADQIPLIARIVSVSDAFHAMISKRPYRKAIPIPDAVRILLDGRGTQWDAEVVDVMVEMVRPVRAVQENLRAVGEAS